MYNCEKQVIRVLNQFDNVMNKYIDEIVIVNNISTDNGEQAVIEYAKKNSKKLSITVLRNEENYNLGGSHKVAFKYAVDNDFDYVIVLHGDDQGNIKDFLPYLKSAEYKNYDAILGSRFMKGSKLCGYSKFRTFGNRVYNILFSLALGKKITDLGAGLNMYKVSTLKDEYYFKYPDKLTFNCYMLLAIKSYNQDVKFVPITWREDDQVSNVKMISQAWLTFKIAFFFFFKRKPYLESEHRDKIVKNYAAEVVYKTKTRKE